MTTAKEVVLATANQGKAREFNHAFGKRVKLIPQSEFGVESIPETGASFAANALLKAQHAAKVTGLAALADDSGLMIDALNGAPGIYSARFAGEDATDADNVAKVLTALTGIRNAQRSARFCCVLAYISEQPEIEPVLAEAYWHGSIAEFPRGNNGFGYDPIFVDAKTGNTAAELAADDKRSLSHRGQAIQKLKVLLPAVFA